MAKSPEEYLKSLDFNAAPEEEQKNHLDAGERAFIEKYLGLDALASLPVQDPEPLLLPQLEEKPVAAAPVLLKEKEICVAPPKIAPPLTVVKPIESTEKKVEAPPAVDKEPAKIHIAAPAVGKQDTSAKIDVAPENPAFEKTQKAALAPEPVKVVIQTPAKPVQAPIQVKTANDQVAAKPAVVKVKEEIAVQDASLAKEPQIKAAPQERNLREKLRHADEIQVVSFYVVDQLFLLPVEGIQEVVRHMELIKVPQAPAFIAGAINLRGTVMPLIKLSALLTNAENTPYDRNNFVIIAGSENLRMGLIIDRVKSMHMIPQKKIIWNAESKLGDAAEFLSAIVDLDDHVCGMISPDLITQKILPELFNP